MQQNRYCEGLGKYQILYFDFSKAAAGKDSLEVNFNAYCETILDGFAEKKYAKYYSATFLEEFKQKKDAASKLIFISNRANAIGIQQLFRQTMFGYSPKDV